MNHMPTLNKYQVETAAKLLRDTLDKRAETIADENFKQDMHKFSKELSTLAKKSIELVNLAKATRTTIEKNSGLTLDLDNYQSFTYHLPNSLEDAEQNDRIIKAKGGSGWHSSNRGKYEPAMSELRLEIEEFILNLKLGTVVMADLKPLLNKITKATK